MAGIAFCVAVGRGHQRGWRYRSGSFNDIWEGAANESKPTRVEAAIDRVKREWLSLDEDHFVHMVLAYAGDSNVDRKIPSGLNIQFSLSNKTISQREVVGEDIRPQVIDLFLIRNIRRVARVYLREVRRNNRKRLVACQRLRHIDFKQV
jgi:hypothetical protein